MTPHSEALAGTTCVHFDVRSDNLLIARDRVVLVDWNWTSAGADWIDVVCLALEVHVTGGDAEHDPDAAQPDPSAQGDAHQDQADDRRDRLPLQREAMTGCEDRARRRHHESGEDVDHDERAVDLLDRRVLGITDLVAPLERAERLAGLEHGRDGLELLDRVALAFAAATLAQLGVAFSVALIAFAIHLGWQARQVRTDDGVLALRLFKSNTWAGVILFIALALGALR